MRRILRSKSAFSVCAAFLFCVTAGIHAAAAADLTVWGHRAVQLEGGGDDKRVWAVRLSFNNPVFQNNLAALLTVQVDGAAENYDLLAATGEPAPDAASKTFVVASTEKHDRPVSVVVRIDKGLGDSTGHRTLKKDFSFRFMTVEKVSVSDVSAYFKSKRDRGVRFRTSRYVSPGEIADAVEMEPEVPNLQFVHQYGMVAATGDFEYNRDYQMSVRQTLVPNKGYMFSAQKFSFKGPGLPKQIDIKASTSTIELIGRQLLPLTVADYEALRCSMTRVPGYLIPTNNLTEEVAVAFGAAPKPKGLPEHADRFFAPVTQDAEAFFSPESKQKITPYSIPLSFRKNPDKGGAFLVALGAPETESAKRTRKLLQITDLSITHKISAEGMLIWVTSIHKGEPVPNVSIMLCDAGAARLFAGKTGPDGALLLKKGATLPSLQFGAEKKGVESIPLQPTSMKWIVAATDGDCAGVETTAQLLKPTNVTQTPKAGEKPNVRTGAVFTERGIYRPGETVNFKFTARAYLDGIGVPTGESVQMTVTNPRDEEVYSKELTLNEFGACWDTLATKSFFAPGTYTVKAALTIRSREARGIAAGVGADGRPVSADRTETFTTTFLVQEFKKARHYCSISVKDGMRPQAGYVGVAREEAFVEATVSARYYTGGPVKNARMRWKAMLAPVTQKVPGFDSFTFGSEDTDERFLESGETTLDRDGNAKFVVPLDPKFVNGSFGVRISATAVDIDGEPATDVATFSPKPPFLVGIANHPSTVPSDYSSPLVVVVADAEGRAVSKGRVEALLMQKDYFYVNKRDEEGNLKPTYEQGWVRSFSTSLEIADSKAVFDHQFNDPGEYLLEFSYTPPDTGKPVMSRARFTVGYSPRGGSDDTANRAEILVSLNKKEYKSTDKIVAQFTTPRPVRWRLAAIERGDVLEYSVAKVESKTGVVEFPLKKEYRPNVFVSILAPAGRADYPMYADQGDPDLPLVYYGYAEVPVRDETVNLKLEIAPDVRELTGRPAEEKKLTFRVTDPNGRGVPAEMAIAVVDEAVLALTGFKTPDLSPLLKFNLPLAVFMGDSRLDLISQDAFRLLGVKPLTGGGAGLGDVNPSLRKDFRPTAYFNPSVRTDESGVADIEFRLPDSTTAYRVYAVVCDKVAGFVSGQRQMTVVKEFFIEPSPPRFFIPGDKALFPITLHNKTKGKGNAALQVTSSPGISLSVEKTEIPLDPFSSESLKAKTEVVGRDPQAVFTFQGKMTADGNIFTDGVELKLPVKPKILPIIKTLMGDIAQKGEIQTGLPPELAQLPADDLNPVDYRAVLSVSALSWAKLAPSLRYLVAYPYGCVEQTSSGVMPLAGMRDLVARGVIPGYSSEQVDKFLKAGVDRLLSMQLADGGFAYWPGSIAPSWWGSVYATFALLTARDAGIELPADRLDKACAYIAKRVLDTNDQEVSGKDRPNWTAMALYAAASGGKLKPGDIEPFIRNLGAASNTTRAFTLLAAHKLNAMPKPKALEALAKLDPKLDRSGYYYDSSYLELAACMLAASEWGIDDKKVGDWSGKLMRSIKPEGRWGSTADTGWALLALAKHFKKKDSAKPGSYLVRAHFGGETSEFRVMDTAHTIELPISALVRNPVVKIESDAKDVLHYALEMTYPETPAKKPVPSALNVAKYVTNLNGSSEIRVGDVLKVRLVLELGDQGGADRSGFFEYLVLDDPVPAGVVAINAELKSEGRDADGDSDKDQDDADDPYSFMPSYQEFRDEGVRVFKNRIYPGVYEYSYFARAVMEGEFFMRSTRLSLMYKPETQASVPGTTVKILPAQ